MSQPRADRVDPPRRSFYSQAQWRRGREAEGTRLLNEHTPNKGIEGSNPSVSATLSICLQHVDLARVSDVPFRHLSPSRPATEGAVPSAGKGRVWRSGVHLPERRSFKAPRIVRLPAQIDPRPGSAQARIAGMPGGCNSATAPRRRSCTRFAPNSGAAHNRGKELTRSANYAGIAE